MPTELNQKKLEVLKLKNKDLKEEFDRGVELVNEVKSKNSLLVTKIEEQKNIQASLLAKI
ncbi:MAG: hypothetical protein HON90_14985, partial [Halobacteriovoraceae bacterium]|nr:hypothetical protein [Halobacteriovoraceae bacterium]